MTNEKVSSPTYAVIDLGSTSFHMVIAKKANNSLQIISKTKQHLQLAAGLDQQNRLRPEMMQKGLDCLAAFAMQLESRAITHVRIIATHTLRVAKNAHLFLRLAAKVIPYPIEIISGQEEARLSYFAIAYNNSEQKQGNILTIDIGGGSTELAIGHNLYPILVESKHIGCVTLSNHLFTDPILDHSVFKQAQLIAEREFENIIWQYRQQGWKKAYGSSGTIKAVHNMLIALEMTDGIITAKKLNFLIDYLYQFNTLDELTLSALSENRKPIFLAGLAILSALFSTLAIKELVYCPDSLREGVLFEEIDPDHHHKSVLIRNITTLSSQYNIDKTQTNKVSRTALYLYKQLCYEYKKIDRQELKTLLYYASQLYSIGLIINHDSIHKHSYYILKNSNLPGFNQEQQRFLALLVRHHRKSVKLNSIEPFTLFTKKEFVLLLQILRIAILLNNQRQTNLSFDQLIVSFKKKYITLTLPKECLQDNALLQFELEKEQLYWQNYPRYQLIIQ